MTFHLAQVVLMCAIFLPLSTARDDIPNFCMLPKRGLFPQAHDGGLNRGGCGGIKCRRKHGFRVVAMIGIYGNRHPAGLTVKEAARTGMPGLSREVAVTKRKIFR